PVNAQGYQSRDPRHRVGCDGRVRLPQDVLPSRWIGQLLWSAAASGGKCGFACDLGCPSAARPSALSIGHDAKPAAGIKRVSLHAESVFVQAVTTDFRERLDA